MKKVLAIIGCALAAQVKKLILIAALALPVIVHAEGPKKFKSYVEMRREQVAKSDVEYADRKRRDQEAAILEAAYVQIGETRALRALVFMKLITNSKFHAALAFAIATIAFSSRAKAGDYYRRDYRYEVLSAYLESQEANRRDRRERDMQRLSEEQVEILKRLEWYLQRTR